MTRKIPIVAGQDSIRGSTTPWRMCTLCRIGEWREHEWILFDADYRRVLFCSIVQNAVDESKKKKSTDGN